MAALLSEEDRAAARACGTAARTLRLPVQDAGKIAGIFGPALRTIITAGHPGAEGQHVPAA